MIEENKTKSFISRFFSWLWRNKWWVIALLIVLGILCWWLCPKIGSDKKDFIVVDITNGDIVHTVTATGEIQPVNTVNVGSQVSGTIEEIFVDYNSKVKQGDILLKIEPSVLQSTVDENKAQLESAKSQLKYFENEYKRNKTLYSDGFVSRAEMEQSQTNYEQAEQSVKKAQYTYERAVTNLGYATITSPVDGTVISRKVDKGQTVAASFQTPDLFEIAEDLSKMQIETAVSEADIGMIKEGVPVTFTVDAYPQQNFQGRIRQIRLSPTTVSNVVVYTVVINVDNTDLKLMPGMTAFVNVVVAQAQNIKKVQNSGLLIRSYKNLSENVGDDISPKTHLAILRDKKLVFVPYQKGIVTPTETQIISSDIQPNDKLVVGFVGQTTQKKSTIRP